jgi:hypothetical protein
MSVLDNYRVKRWCCYVSMFPFIIFMFKYKMLNRINAMWMTGATYVFVFYFLSFCRQKDKWFSSVWAEANEEITDIRSKIKGFSYLIMI